MTTAPREQQVLANYKLPELPYDYDSLEPYINAEIMRLHHSKHHQAYVNNFNKDLEEFQEAARNNDVGKMMLLQNTIKFNGGGHINHCLFWTNLAPKDQGGGESPVGELAEEIEREWGTFEAFKEKFNAIVVAIQGSGWGWLGFCTASKRLMIVACCNQDPLILQGLIPILGVDVWEHAYYLQYKNAKLEYLKAIWEVVNWKNVAELFQDAKAAAV